MKKGKIAATHIPARYKKPGGPCRPPGAVFALYAYLLNLLLKYASPMKTLPPAIRIMLPGSGVIVL